MKKQILIFAFSLLAFWACSSQKNANSEANTFETLQAQAFEQKMKESPNAQVLDVRSAEECASGVISSASQIEYGSSDFEAKAQKLDKTKPVFVYCQGGVRSAKAAAQLKEMGFQSVFNLQGGIKAWAGSGLPVSMLP